jgi:hypothetical protein
MTTTPACADTQYHARLRHLDAHMDWLMQQFTACQQQRVQLVHDHFCPHTAPQKAQEARTTPGEGLGTPGAIMGQSEGKYSPFPWRINPKAPWEVLDANGLGVVIDYALEVSDHQASANARLLAAAPALLQIVRRYAYLYATAAGQPSSFFVRLYEDAQAVLAQVEEHA